MHPHTNRDSKTFSTAGEDQVKEFFTPIWQPHTLGGKEQEKMRASKYYFDEFSNIAQDRYIHGKAFSNEALQRGLPHMLGHLTHGHAWQLPGNPMIIETPC